MIGPWLNTVGLMLGMIGVAVIFCYGPPQPNFEPHAPIAQELGTASDHIDAVRRRTKQHRFWSSIGLILIFFGFLFQLIATWPNLLKFAG